MTAEQFDWLNKQLGPETEKPVNCPHCGGVLVNVGFWFNKDTGTFHCGDSRCNRDIFQTWEDE